MDKLIAIKNKYSGRVTRVPMSLFKAMDKIGNEHGRFKHYIPVPKKL